MPPKAAPAPAYEPSGHAPDATMKSLPPTLRFIERDWLSSNQMLFVEPDGATLVDSGYGTRADFTVALVRRVL